MYDPEAVNLDLFGGFSLYAGDGFGTSGSNHFQQTFKLGKVILSKSRSITHRRIKECIYKIDTDPEILSAIQAQPELIWIKFSELETITLSGPHRRWVNELLAKGD